MTAITVSSIPRVAKIILHGVPDRPGAAAELFGALGDLGMNVEMMVQSSAKDKKCDLSFAVLQDKVDAVLSHLNSIKGKVGVEEISHQVGLAIVSVSAKGLIKEPGVAGQIFAALSGQGINIEMVSTSLSSVSCVIAQNRADDALKALRERFLQQ